MCRAYVFKALIGMLNVGQRAGVVVVLLYAAQVQAAELVLNIPIGSTFAEVTKAFGSPSEKVEKESRRVDQWIYPAGDITFLNGRVIRASQKLNPTFSSGGAPSAQAKTERVDNAGPASAVDATAESPQLRAILNEIKTRTDAAPSGAPTALKNESVTEMLKRAQGNSE